MKKKSFRNKINSIFGSHIDPDKDEELKGSNIEMEDNYKKILELLKEEDSHDRDKLVELIEDFHKHHQSIYNRYDHITGELKAKVHSKKDNDSSSSSSSDSDSDDPINKKGSKNGKLKVAYILKEQLQAANTEIEELTKKLTLATEEKEALSSECQAALNKEQETEKMLGELKLEVDRLHEENSKLSAEFSQKLEATKEELSNVTKTLEATEEEKKSLSIKGSELADEIQELATKCSQLQEKLADKENELLNHLEMHTSHKSETEIRMRGF
ncbi:unnamed protein product [Lactuca virosa]|uniref:NAB domain-containing protein n=1 Tax=Lactuca virosa TaxID=75947 RepID=A0AAU9PM95_9ASTR|nr:unnamed protein product [Lactuca virosa]